MLDTAQIIVQFNPAGIKDYSRPAKVIDRQMDENMSKYDLANLILNTLKDECPRAPKLSEDLSLYLTIAMHLRAKLVRGGISRKDLKKGMIVEIVLKKDQANGHLTRGVIKDFLTNTKEHPHGIKVRLDMNCNDAYRVGRVRYYEVRN